MDMQYTRTMLHDGYFNNLLANLNVNDIETVTVLKSSSRSWPQSSSLHG